MDMKQTIAFLAVVIAFGASGQVFGIDAKPYEAQDEFVPVKLEHFEAVID